MLNETQQLLWDEYLELETQKVRSALLTALERFVDELVKTPLPFWRSWALDIAERAVDGDHDITVRFPLFRRVLFPALLEGLRAQEPGCARWLAGFSNLIYQSPECAESLGDEASEIALLRKALRLDQNDALARGRIVHALRWELDYSLHELPSGVLFSLDGATIEECEELQGKLAEFERLVLEHGTRAEHEEIIQECRLHYWAYPDYLRRRSHFESYADYLDRTGAA